MHSYFNRVLTPGLRNAQYAYFDALQNHIPQNAHWLEVGCGHQIVLDWMLDAEQLQNQLLQRADRIVGIDLDLHSLKKNNVIPRLAMADLERLAFADQSFDAVTANMVVEHVEHPDRALAEVRRVLRPGGVFIFHTPNFLNPVMLLGYPIPQALKDRLVAYLEGRPPDDVFPTRYQMNTVKRIKQLARHADLDVVACDLVESSPNTYMLGPLVALELLMIRLARRPAFANLRSNIVTTLRRPS